MSRNSANVPNCPRHGHPAPPHLPAPRPLPERCRWWWWAWQTVCCCCVFFILFSVILLCDPSVDFMYLFMGKLGKWLSLHFPSLSRALGHCSRCQRLQLWSLHTICPGRVASAPPPLQLVRISFSDFQLAFLPRPISRSPLCYSTSHGFNNFGPRA